MSEGFNVFSRAWIAFGECQVSTQGFCLRAFGSGFQGLDLKANSCGVS